MLAIIDKCEESSKRIYKDLYSNICKYSNRPKNCNLTSEEKQDLLKIERDWMISGLVWKM